MNLKTILDILKGGPGSGNFGHAGRPGKRGGSAPKTGWGAAMSLRTGPTADKRQQEVAKRSRNDTKKIVEIPE